MRSRIVVGALLACALATPALAGTSVQIGLGINAPPPRVIYQQEPRWVMIPDQRVYVVQDDGLDYDYFRYGGSYWIYNDDNWYRARRYNGPFYGVRADYVPGPIWQLGDRDHYRWRHHPHGMPPGLAKKYRRDGWSPGYAYEERGDRSHGNGHGKGNGKGHGHDNERGDH